MDKGTNMFYNISNKKQKTGRLGSPGFLMIVTVCYSTSLSNSVESD